MSSQNQIYTSATWVVKPGNESRFIEAWTRFAAWTRQNHPASGNGQLLQEFEHSTRFISFGPWADRESIAAWRAAPEFAAFMAEARELCEEVRPSTFVVVSSSPK